MKGTYIHKSKSVLSKLYAQALTQGFKAKLTYQVNSNIYKLTVK